jgi:hypothetical protein
MLRQPIDLEQFDVCHGPLTVVTAWYRTHVALTQRESARDFSPVLGERAESSGTGLGYLQFRDLSCNANNASFPAKNANSCHLPAPWAIQIIPIRVDVHTKIGQRFLPVCRLATVHPPILLMGWTTDGQCWQRR